MQFRNRPLPAGNPLASALVVIVGAVVIALSLVLGFFALLALAAFVLVGALVMTVRSWWFRRRYPGGSRTAAGPPSGQSGAEVIEGEFRDVTPDTRTDRPGES